MFEISIFHISGQVIAMVVKSQGSHGTPLFEGNLGEGEI